MAAFVLESDNQFVTPSTNGKYIWVLEYEGDMNDVQIIRRGRLGKRICQDQVGRSSDQYTALQVFGVVIEGERLRGLARELRGIEEGNNLLIYVNRLGLCMITEISHPSIAALRINDYFGWSKYGVRVPHDAISTPAAMWNKVDMSNGETVMDAGGMVKAAEEGKELRPSPEEQIRDAELAACRKELEWSKKMESVLSKLVDEKERQLVAFKAALRELVDLREDELP